MILSSLNCWKIYLAFAFSISYSFSMIPSCNTKQNFLLLMVGFNKLAKVLLFLS